MRRSPSQAYGINIFMENAAKAAGECTYLDCHH